MSRSTSASPTSPTSCAPSGARRACRREDSVRRPKDSARSSKNASLRWPNVLLFNGGSMFDHIGLRVKDLDAASRLYTAMLAPLGCVPGAKGDGYAGFGPKGSSALWLHADSAGGGAHIALRSPDRKAVDEFHKAGIRAGARDNGKPGLRKIGRASCR